MTGASWRGDEGLAALAAALAPGEVLVTGGAVRDTLLGIEPDDFDVVACVPPGTGRDALAAAGIAREPHPFMPDVDFASLRVGRVRHVSIAYVGDRDGIDADAARRDFTCNAIYLTLDGVARDPLGGMRDLADRVLRAAAPGAFLDDPVRILRAPRMLRRLGNGRESPGLGEAMAAAAPGLAGCPAVRVVRELSKLLDLTDADEAIADVRLLDRSGALRVIFPEADIDGFAAYCRTCRDMDAWEGDESFPRIGVLGRRPGQGYDGRVAAWGDARDDRIAACAAAVDAGACESVLVPTPLRDALLTHSRTIRVGGAGAGEGRG